MSISIQHLKLKSERWTKYCFLVFVIVLSTITQLSQAKANGSSRQVWILLGNLPDTRPALKRGDWTLQKSLIDQATEVFQKYDIEIIVKQEATGADLWDAWNEPKLVGLFWIGHSSMQKSSGYVVPKQIIDVKGMNVASLFTRMPKNLLYLGLIGCEAKLVLGSLTTLPNNNRYRRIDSFDTKVDAETATAQSLIHADRFFDSLFHHSVEEINYAFSPQAISQSDLTIRVRRGPNARGGVDVALLTKKRLIGYLKKTESEAEFRIPEAWLENGKVEEIVVDTIRSQSSLTSQEIIDELEITGPSGDKWLPRKIGDRIIGRSFHTYKLEMY